MRVIVDTREIAAEYRLKHWAEIIQERNESGMSIKAYCNSIGLRQNVYHYWQCKLREAAVITSGKQKEQEYSSACVALTLQVEILYCPVRQLVSGTNQLEVAG